MHEEETEPLCVRVGWNVADGLAVADHVALCRGEAVRLPLSEGLGDGERLKVGESV